jgi:hypothetical protein
MAAPEKAASPLNAGPTPQVPAEATGTQAKAAEPAPAAEPETTIVLDTVPPGANIVVGGKVIADTPEDMKVKNGATLAIVLTKPGYVDHPLVLDPQNGHKQVVKLEKVHKESRPRPAVSTAPAPSRGGKPAKRGSSDPYERLDDAPKKGSEVINPYQ